MNDLHILSKLEQIVGRNIRHEVEGESVVGISLTSDDFVFQGLIRHHTVSEKAEILSLIARLESLRKLGKAFGTGFEVCPPATGGRPITLPEMARDLADRLINIFKRDAAGRRPVYDNVPKFQKDPLWWDLIQFYEYFQGDTGAGLGASHQTGWTALVASLIDEWRS